MEVRDKIPLLTLLDFPFLRYPLSAYPAFDYLSVLLKMYPRQVLFI